MSPPDQAQAGFVFCPPKPAPKPTEQQKQLARVKGDIAESCHRWCVKRIDSDRFFRLAEFTAAICSETGCAPDSPRRILGLLRDEGRVRLTVLSKTGSYYRLDEVRP